MYKYNREQSFHCFIYIQHGTLDTEYRVVETQLEDKLPIFMAMGDSLLRITINRGGAVFINLREIPSPERYEDLLLMTSITELMISRCMSNI
jgi:hypothetical protein